MLMSNALYKNNTDIPKEMILGNLLFLTLTDVEIPANVLATIFTNNNIPEKYVKDISPADAFRRATSSVKNKIIQLSKSSGGTEKVRVEIDEVRSDPAGIKRIIGFKSVDEINEDINYKSVGEAIFVRSTGKITVMPSRVVSNPEYTEADNLCKEIKTKFDSWVIYHNKDTVRNIINRIVTDTHPVNLMPTGICKFIPVASMDLLYNLKNALEEINAYSVSNGNTKNIVEIIPVINTVEQRQMIEKNFKAEITDELFKFTQELKGVITKRQALSSKTAVSYIEKFNTLKEKAKEYEEMLGIYIASLHEQIKESIKLVDDNTKQKKDS